MNIKKILADAPEGAHRYNRHLLYPYLRKTKTSIEYWEHHSWVKYTGEIVIFRDGDWNDAVTLASLQRGYITSDDIYDTDVQRAAESSAVKTRKCRSLMCENMVEGDVGTYCGCNHQSVDEIDNTVTQRGERYGLFADGAVIMQDLKTVMRATPGWERLTPSQREALEMIQHKIGRVLNGDPTYDDSWRDIAGYATLILNELNGVKR